MKKRLLSLVLALALVITMRPALSIEAMAATINDSSVFVKQSESAVKISTISPVGQPQ